MMADTVLRGNFPKFAFAATNATATQESENICPILSKQSIINKFRVYNQSKMIKTRELRIIYSIFDRSVELDLER